MVTCTAQSVLLSFNHYLPSKKSKITMSYNWIGELVKIKSSRKSRPRYEPVGRFAGFFDVCDIFLMYQHVMCRLYVGNSV